MKKISRFLLTAFAIISFAGLVIAQDDILNANHPDRYVVKKGDTLWDISGMFLRKPWLWPEIWHVNPQIANPHLIYPGDELELVYIDGKPRLQLAGTSRLSPGIRTTPWDGAIPVIPVDAIAPFLSRPYVVDKEQLENAPYIVAFADEHIAAGAGQRFYVRTVEDETHSSFDVVRPGGEYKDADTGEVLGHEALYVGTSELQRTGDPATLLLRNAQIEALVGDRLFPAEESKAIGDFHPRLPEKEVKGSIISVLNGVTQIGQYNIIVLDRGEADGLMPGAVLQIDHRGETIKDPLVKKSLRNVIHMSPAVDADQAAEEAEKQQQKTHSKRSREVTLPDEKAGLAMVFRTFQRVSFAIVMDATRAIHVLDRVRNPE